MLNEFIISTVDIFLPIYIRLFDYILQSGKIPNDWVNDDIFSIYENKGDVNSPGNYRGITILGCFGKFFTSLLNQRLGKFLETHNILNENQTGFRKTYSTDDHVFSMKCLIDMFFSKKLFCAFIDYQKAFDTIWRSGLWSKLIASGISGKVFNVIRNIYQCVKLCVSMNGNKSDYFMSYTGVRQGENLSPLLFSPIH